MIKGQGIGETQEVTTKGEQMCNEVLSKAVASEREKKHVQLVLQRLTQEDLLSDLLKQKYKKMGVVRDTIQDETKKKDQFYWSFSSLEVGKLK